MKKLPKDKGLRSSLKVVRAETASAPINVSRLGIAQAAVRTGGDVGKSGVAALEEELKSLPKDNSGTEQEKPAGKRKLKIKKRGHNLNDRQS